MNRIPTSVSVFIDMQIRYREKSSNSGIKSIKINLYIAPGRILEIFERIQNISTAWVKGTSAPPIFKYYAPFHEITVPYQN